MVARKYDTPLEVTTKEYRAWSNMKTRCDNPKYPLFHRYGGRGISICPQWRDYATFLSDMGRAPSKGSSIDRIDNNKGYSPDNCRWQTPVEQARNRSTNKLVRLGDEERALAEWCEDLPISYEVANRRLSLGWSAEDALLKPKGYKRYRYITPDGEFENQDDVAAHYGLKLKTVSARFCSKTMADWKKVAL